MNEAYKSPDQILSLWELGYFWEIFGFTDNSFTANELARNYSARRKLHKDSSRVSEVLEQTFSVLNAPVSRDSFKNARYIMNAIAEDLDKEEFQQYESCIWGNLWRFVSQDWKEPSQDEVDFIVQESLEGNQLSKQDITDNIDTDNSLNQEDMDELFRYIINQLNAGKSRREIAFELSKKGVPFENAVQMTKMVDERREQSGTSTEGEGCLSAIIGRIVGLAILGGIIMLIGFMIDTCGC